MHKDKYVFAQLVEFLDHNKFRRFLDKNNGDFRIRHFSCRNQLLALIVSYHAYCPLFATFVSRHADCPLFAPFFWPGQCSWRGGRGPHFIFQNDKNALIFH